jgi:beta-glucosidase
MKSPVMDRSLGRVSEEELEAENSMQEEDKVDFDMDYHEVGEHCVIDTRDLDTSKGSSKVFGLLTNIMGIYGMRMKVKVDASELAQVSVSITSNGNHMGVLTLNGTNGEWVEIEQHLGEFNGMSNFVRLFFAESGIPL